MNRIEGKVALVSGAGQGIGAKTAEILAAAGATVVVTDIRESNGIKVTEKIKDAGYRAVFKKLDVTVESDWKEVMEQTCGEFGGLDILVNNAGVELIKPIAMLSLEDWHWICRINLDGVFLGTKYGIHAMTAGSTKRPKGGSIINLSSVAGLIGTAFQSAYNMTKGGVRLFTKSAALECAALKNGIRVNSVHPGVIQTPMGEELIREFSRLGGSVDAARENVRSEHPIGRLGEPEDVARAILYLASDDSSFVTGAELVVDGGLTAK